MKLIGNVTDAVKLTLVSTTLVDQEAFLRAILPASIKPGKTLDAIPTRNNKIYDYLVLISASISPSITARGIMVEEALSYVDFTFVIECPNGCYIARLDSVITLMCDDPMKRILILGQSLREWKSFVYLQSREHTTIESRLVGNLLLLTFDQMGLAAIWKDYRREKLADGTFTLRLNSDA